MPTNTAKLQIVQLKIPILVLSQSSSVIPLKEKILKKIGEQYQEHLNYQKLQKQRSKVRPTSAQHKEHGKIGHRGGFMALAFDLPIYHKNHLSNKVNKKILKEFKVKKLIKKGGARTRSLSTNLHKD